MKYAERALWSCSHTSVAQRPGVTSGIDDRYCTNSILFANIRRKTSLIVPFVPGGRWSLGFVGKPASDDRH